MKLLTTAAALLLSVALISQVKTSKDFLVEKGIPYKVVDAPLKYYFNHGDDIISLKFDKGEIITQKYSADGIKQTKFGVISKKTLPKGYILEEFVQCGEHLFQFFNAWDRSSKSEQIYYQKFNFEDPSKPEKPVKILSTTKMVHYNGHNKIDTYTSYDKGKVLVTYRLHPEKRSDKVNRDKIGLYVYDRDMNEVWGEEIEMPETEANMDNLGYTVDAKGNAYLLARVRSGENAVLKVFKYSGNGSEPVAIEVEAEGKFFTNGIKLYEADNGEIYLAGFFGERGITKYIFGIQGKGAPSAKGVYFARLDGDQLIDERFHDIPLGINNSFVSERQKEINDKSKYTGKGTGIDHLKINEINIRNDGSVIITAEVFFVLAIRVETENGSKIKYQHHYKDILVLKLRADGSLDWMHRIPKRQIKSKFIKEQLLMMGGIDNTQYDRSNVGKGDLSFRYMKTGDSHYIVYLDNLKNLNLQIDQDPAIHKSEKGGYLTACKINDRTGEIEKHSIFDTRKVKGITAAQFGINRMVQTREDELIMEVYKKGKQDVLLRVKLNEL